MFLVPLVVTCESLRLLRDAVASLPWRTPTVVLMSIVTPTVVLMSNVVRLAVGYLSRRTRAIKYGDSR